LKLNQKSEKEDQVAILKKTIEEYWSRNVPGLDINSKKASPDTKEFFIEVDNFRFANEPYVPTLIDSFARQGVRVLEIGCGLGSDSRYMAKRGTKITSLDLSFSNVSSTIQGMRLLGLSGRGVCSDAENLPFATNTFDTVYSFGVLHHTPDTKKAIDEVYRVLKPGGKAVVMLYHKGYAYLYINMLFGIKRLFISEEKLISQHYDFTPLSKMYSKKQAQRLFNKFSSVKFEVTTFAFGGININPKLKLMHNLLKNDFLMNKLGQFLIIKAEKGV
jgi:ubiquinone/menaquinone biosynthesis C-methylase UbiE